MVRVIRLDKERNPKYGSNSLNIIEILSDNMSSSCALYTTFSDENVHAVTEMVLERYHR